MSFQLTALKHQLATRLRLMAGWMTGKQNQPPELFVVMVYSATRDGKPCLYATADGQLIGRPWPEVREAVTDLLGRIDEIEAKAQEVSHG